MERIKHDSIEKDDYVPQVEDGEKRPEWTEQFERRLIKKIDLRLLIILGALYSIALVDRTNISSARVAGMLKDLELDVGERYSLIAAIFFVPYILFELPSNILLRKFGCRNVLCSIVIGWGAVMLGMGWLKTWEQLLVCRILLGILEAGFFPGCVYIISCWYTRYETARRMAWFYLTSMFISGFSQIIAYAFSLLHGRAGIPGWSWIFILFGALTLSLGIIAIFIIVDFPDKATFLTESESAFVKYRIDKDRGDSEFDGLSFKKTFMHMLDFKVWAFGLCFMSTAMPVYAFSYFLPVILNGTGLSRQASLLMSAPPYAFAAVYTLFSAWISDRTKKRALFISISSIIAMVGLFIMAYTKGMAPRYIGSFLSVAGAQSNVPAILTYQANNVLTYSKRAVTSAVVIGMGGVGGIFATLIYRQKDYPNYIPGLWATIACQMLILALCAINSFFLHRENKRADRDGTLIQNTPGFRYTI